MVTHFTLVRHGETAWNANGRWQGHAHVPLNEIGRRQAHLLAAHLKAKGTAFKAIIASDSLRAAETARTIGAELGLPVIGDARLREIDIGEWQGLTADEVRAWDPERYAAVDQDPWLVKRPGGESGADVGARAFDCLEEHGQDAHGGHLIAVSHGGTIRNLLQHLSLARADRVVVGNTSCSLLVRGFAEDGCARWDLHTFNAMEHLDVAGLRVEVEP